jgi:hypothetical protein
LLQVVKDSKGKSTGTKLEHLQSVQQNIKKPLPELQFPVVDHSMLFLLDYFDRIKKVRGENITYNELKAFQELNCIDLQAWQVEVIMMIDSIFEGSVHG